MGYLVSRFTCIRWRPSNKRAADLAIYSRLLAASLYPRQRPDSTGRGENPLKRTSTMNAASKTLTALALAAS